MTWTSVQAVLVRTTPLVLSRLLLQLLVGGYKLQLAARAPRIWWLRRALGLQRRFLHRAQAQLRLRLATSRKILRAGRLICWKTTKAVSQFATWMHPQMGRQSVHLAARTWRPECLVVIWMSQQTVVRPVPLAVHQEQRFDLPATWMNRPMVSQIVLLGARLRTPPRLCTTLANGIGWIMTLIHRRPACSARLDTCQSLAPSLALHAPLDSCTTRQVM